MNTACLPKMIGVLGLCCINIVSVQAAVILSPVGASASSEFDATFFDIGNTIDQSGLSTGFVSGVTDFDAYLATNPLHSQFSGNQEWFSTFTTATIVYDLGSVFSIQRLALWNEETAGLGSFDIAVSTDNISFTTVATGLVPFDNPDGSDYGAEVFDFGIQSAQFIRLNVSGCPQPNGSGSTCGMGEIAFATSTVPIPAAVWLFGSGLIGLSGIARRGRA